MKLFIVKLRQKGQITLPAEVRRELGLMENDELVLTLEDDRIVLRPLHSRIPSKYLRASDDEVEYAIVDPEFVPYYYEAKYHGKRSRGDT